MHNYAISKMVKPQEKQFLCIIMRINGLHNGFDTIPFYAIG
jgi:hypothetical protein